MPMDSILIWAFDTGNVSKLSSSVNNTAVISKAKDT